MMWEGVTDVLKPGGSYAPAPEKDKAPYCYSGPIDVGMEFVWLPTGERVMVTEIGTYNGYMRIWCRDLKSGRDVMNDEHRWREACAPVRAQPSTPTPEEPKECKESEQ